MSIPGKTVSCFCCGRETLRPATADLGRLFGFFVAVVTYLERSRIGSSLRRRVLLSS